MIKIGKKGPKQGQNSIKMDENRVKIGSKIASKWCKMGQNGSKWVKRRSQSVKMVKMG